MSNVIERLQKIQQQCEEIYIKSEEDNLKKFELSKEDNKIQFIILQLTNGSCRLAENCNNHSVNTERFFDLKAASE